MSVVYSPPSPLMGRSDLEDGPLAKRVYHYASDKGPCGVMGFACDVGVSRNKGRVGAKDAPAAIRRAFAGLAAPETFSAFVDLGDVGVGGDDLEAGQAMLSERLKKALPDYKRIIVLGGGHETAFGSYSGLRAAYPKASIGIINLDAHLDLRNIGDAGPSSGTPFNQIRELDPKAFDYLCIGAARESNTQALFTRAKDWGVRIIYDFELTASPKAADSEIDAIIERNDIIYLTIDMDVLPHYQAPGVSAPAVRGVSFAALEHIVNYVKRGCRAQETLMPLADIVEVCPLHDKDNMTAKAAAILALNLMS